MTFDSGLEFVKLEDLMRNCIVSTLKLWTLFTCIDPLHLQYKLHTKSKITVMEYVFVG